MGDAIHPGDELKVVVLGAGIVALMTALEMQTQRITNGPDLSIKNRRTGSITITCLPARYLPCLLPSLLRCLVRPQLEKR